MENFLLNFSESLLSKEDMKQILGGKMYWCQCGNLASNEYNASSQSQANQICKDAGSAAGYDPNDCSAHAA